VRLGDLALERDDLGGRLRGIGPAHHAEHLRDILLVARLLRRELLLKVQFAVGQAEAGLAHVEDVEIGVLAVVVDEGAEEAAAETAAQRSPIERAIWSLLLIARIAPILGWIGLASSFSIAASFMKPR
jgi:hypothetical protein